ncbi:Inositol monophosphatase family protein [uncultured Pleomorphomonas sp.]|uniref:Inositol-1-monophosphatase n=1 Tax=uncultured Pleomorphomonas sp. TaxID=442121 RepID=A0A212LEC3_9HYPH|nr:inositol monophosphatase [uncultured Pleomorphomonas sp.]SCM75922.1 Inositol monophosphatase family protein [uncultured Pleomorphomonas sp.]
MTLADDVRIRLDLARTLINEAGRLALSHFADRAHLGIDVKLNGQDVVSVADRGVEALIRTGIAAAFPGDGFLGEESGLADGHSGWRWIVDPIDGTSCFVHGLTSWCVSIALSDAEGQTRFGLILAPVTGELYEAVAEEGARLNGKPIQVDRQTSLETGLVGLGASHRVAAADVASVLEALLTKGGMFVRSGSGALSIAEVAAGRLAAYYEPHINAWDCLAGLLIVREAGGFTADFPGEGRSLLAGGPVLAAAPQIAGPLNELIAGARRRSP